MAVENPWSAIAHENQTEYLLNCPECYWKKLDDLKVRIPPNVTMVESIIVANIYLA